MTTNNYVDLDLYGRGFDGIFGYGAEQENKRQALMKFKAMQRFKERVKPGEYIDLDLYGRGDPRVFGPDAHIYTQKHAQRLMEDVQRRKRDGQVNHGVIMFPVGLKAITRKALQLMKRASSKSLETFGLEERQPSAGENLKNDHEGATEDRAIPSVEETQEEKAALEEPELPNNAPRRFKSKLLSEEVPPHVEPEVVTRAEKSISSQDKIEDDNAVEWNKNALVVQPAHAAARSSNVSRGIFTPEESDSGSSRSASSSGARKTEAAGVVDQTRRLAEPVSRRSEAEVARDILVGSDEEFPLSFSTNVRDVVRNDYNSTSSEEDLLARQPNQERVLGDTMGRTGSAGNKIAGLFCSGDSNSDSESDQGCASEESRGEAGPSRIADSYSSTEDEDVSSEEAGEVMEVSPSTAALVEGHSKEKTPQVSEIEDAQPVLETREASIIKVVETGDLLIDNALENDGNNYIQEMVEATRAAPTTAIETRVAEETAADNTVHDTDRKTANVIGQTAVDLSSSDGSGSSEGVSFDNQGDASLDDAETVDGSAYVTDSDRSGEAGSSSVVMSSSPEEDSDDKEIETCGEVEEESEEAKEEEEEEPEEEEEKDTEEVGVEVTEDYGEVRVVDSSDAEMTSDEDNAAAEGPESDDAEHENGDAEEGNPEGEDGEAKSFWQRLNFFATILHGSWTGY